MDTRKLVSCGRRKSGSCVSNQTNPGRFEGKVRTMAVIEDLASAVERGKKKEALLLLQQAIDEGIDPQVILKDGLIAPMDVVGDKFSRNEIFIPEMLVAARAMAACTDVLKPLLAGDDASNLGKIVIGTVAGDMHDIGKNLVKMMLEGKGFEVTDLGVDVPAEKFVEFVKENPDTKIVCISALLTTTMPAMADTVKALDEAGLHEGRFFMVGGAPITQAFADEIGADVYTNDAGSCAVEAAKLVA